MTTQISPEKAPRLGRKMLALGFALCIGVAALWLSRPASLYSGQRASSTQSCLSNQERIGLAFAQYMKDYEGKFPRGVDAEDRFNPLMWNQPGNRRFQAETKTAPMLPDLLFPYLRTREVWRCPDDIGYRASRLPGLDHGLTNVFPSSFARFGMSYSYLTLRGLEGMRAADFRDPGRNVSLSDADLWHGTRERPSVNALFADGHAQNLSAAQFEMLMQQEW